MNLLPRINAILVLGGLLTSLPALAVLEVVPATRGSISTTRFHYGVVAVGDASLATNTATSWFDTEAGFNYMDVTQTSVSDPGHRHMFEFDVFSPGARAGSNLVLVVQAGGQSTTASALRPMPIASVDGIACNSESSSVQQVCLNPFRAADGILRYYGARYVPGSRIKIGLYPKEVCAEYQRTGPSDQAAGTALGCTLGEVTSPTALVAGGVVEMQLTFSVQNPPTAATGGGTTAGSEVEKLAPILTFQVDRPVFGCASDLSNIYFPGDSQIYVDSSRFNAITASANRARGTHLLVVGRQGGDPVLANQLSQNEVFDRVILGLTKTVAGFQNIDANGNPAYVISFGVRDAAGIIAVPAIASPCKIEGVRTSSIPGFLDKNHCFIASAAFRSGDGPVAMLRQFRDRVLLKSGFGNRFVQWYYRWSPPAAEWLMRNPVFRVPVLTLLLPVEAFAWLCLHPAWLAAVLASQGFCVFAFVSLSRRRGVL